MPERIIVKRGLGFPISSSGISLGEPAFSTALNTFHIGLGAGITPVWLGAPISGLSADIAAGITYKLPTAEAVRGYILGLCYGNTGAPTITQYVSSFNGLTGAVQGVSSWNGQTGAVTFTDYVSSFNGLTGAVGGVTTSVANTFVSVQSFSGGISSAGGTFTQEVRFTSGLTASVVKTLNISGNGTLSPSFTDGQFRLSQFMGTFTTVQTSGSTDRTISLPDADGTLALTSQLMGAVNGSTAATTAVTSFNGRTGTVQGVSSWNGQTGAVSFVDYVTSFNGLTGAVQGVTVGGANTFTALNVFSGGLSASGGVTFSGTVASDTGYRITSNAINAQTGTTYTLSTTDNGKIVTFNTSSPVTVTIPTGLSVGFSVTVIQLGTGQVEFAADVGVTLNSYNSMKKIIGQHGSASVIVYSTNTANLAGSLT